MTVQVDGRPQGQGPSSNPGTHIPNHSSKTVSPVIPAILVVFSVFLIATIAWWLRRSLRRSRRYLPLLTRLGFGWRPELVDVRVEAPRNISKENSGWMVLLPLAAARKPDSAATSRYSSQPLPTSYSHRQIRHIHGSPGNAMEMYNRSTSTNIKCRQTGLPVERIQITVFVAMPSSHKFCDSNAKSPTSVQKDTPAVCVGVAEVPWLAR
ncbi:hypothetical protein C8Q79DRAFT_88638 [Trametes meyenii]|nr:hypothetical protein C8Q79DRAFT_88638 [Trametes meyenii]